MSLLAGVLNVVLGTVYLGYGLITWFELRRGWRTRGTSHFGLAWLFMAFTCGPHHLDHGAHLLADGYGDGLDVAVTLLGFPAGVTWFLLRVEAVLGGSGDREVADGNPLVEALPTMHLAYGVVLTGLVASLLSGATATFVPSTVPNLLLVVLYGLVGCALLRTQLVNHRVDGHWSLSGLALAVVFPTCAVMHLVHAANVMTGTYANPGHLVVVDALGVPAAAYFLWTVWMLSTGRMRDWNEAARHSQADADDQPDAAVGLV